jgi:hypothetical protein
MATQVSRRSWVLLALIGMLLIGGLVMSGPGTPLISAAGSEQPQGGISVHWAHLYHDLKSLKGATDVAVVGTISAVAEQGIRGATPYTDFTLTVNRVLFNHKQALVGNSVRLHQLGGTGRSSQQQAVHMEVVDDPLFQVGDQVIVFLHEYSPGRYYVEGGPSGRFHINKDMVTPINSKGIHLPTAMSVDQFASQVSQA